MWWYRIGLFSVLAPMTLGTAAFVTWLVSHWDILMLDGLVTIVVGLLLFPIGIFALVMWMRRASPRKKFCLLLCLLFLNFPLAWGMISYASYYVVIRHEVTVTNNASVPVTQIYFTDPMGNDYQMDNVPAGTSLSQLFPFAGEGSVHYRMTVENKEASGVLLGYITGGIGTGGKDARVVVTVNSNNEVIVHEIFGQ